MNNHTLTIEELIDSLAEQLSFLDASLTLFSKNDLIIKYDNKQIGNPFLAEIKTEVEAKRIGIIIRLLLHHTKNSKSLLNQLGVQDKIDFLDTSGPRGKLHSMTNMKEVRNIDPNQFLALVAKINTDCSLLAVPLFKQHQPEWYNAYKRVDFRTWWEMEVIAYNNHSLSRKDLVLFITDKDGGAHVDNSIDLKYYNTKKSSLMLNIMGVDTPLEQNIIYASVAQIGWELINSIDKELIARY